MKRSALFTDRVKATFEPDCSGLGQTLHYTITTGCDGAVHEVIPMVAYQTMGSPDELGMVAGLAEICGVNNRRQWLAFMARMSGSRMT
jgi:hypothetical protein